MLKAFLDKLGKTTGVTYTPEEFKQIIQEAIGADSKSVFEEVAKKELKATLAESVKQAVDKKSK